MKQLTITISGCAGSGKSRLLYLLQNFLIENKFNVSHEMDSINIFDYGNEQKF